MSCLLHCILRNPLALDTPLPFKTLEGGASYQEIIACDKIPPNAGCGGGVPRLVWDWAEAFSVASNNCYMCARALCLLAAALQSCSFKVHRGRHTGKTFLRRLPPQLRLQARGL